MSQLDFNDKVHHLFDDFSKSFSLPEKSFRIVENFSQTGTRAGELISTELDIMEHAYPPTSGDSTAKASLILYIKPNRYCRELLIKRSRFPDIPLPDTADIKDVSDKLYTHVLFSFEDESIYKYISDNIRYCLNTYASSNTFGCCSRYKECSDEKQCVHPNKLYAFGCQYRKNLEYNRVFY